VNTVYNLGEVLLLVQVGQLEDESLWKVKLYQWLWLSEARYLRQPYLPDEVEEIVDVVGMAKVQFGGLKIVNGKEGGERNRAHFVNLLDDAWTLEDSHKFGKYDSIS
jgi:hypothetical protein